MSEVVGEIVLVIGDENPLPGNCRPAQSEIEGSYRRQPQRRDGPGRLLVDGLGAECIKIGKDIAIANTRDVDQFNISSVTKYGHTDADSFGEHGRRWTMSQTMSQTTNNKQA